MLHPLRSARWLCLLALFLPLLGAAQKEPANAPPALKGRACVLVATAGAGYLTLTPADLLDHALLKHAPPRLRESVQELDRELPRLVGVGPRQLQRVTIAFPVGAMTAPVTLLSGTKDFQVKHLQEHLPEWKAGKLGDRAMLTPPRGNYALVFQGPALLLAGRPQDIEGFLERAHLGRADPTLLRGLVAAEDGAQCVLGLRPDDVAAWFLLRGGPAHAPPRVEQKDAPPMKAKDPEPPAKSPAGPSSFPGAGFLGGGFPPAGQFGMPGPYGGSGPYPFHSVYGKGGFSTGPRLKQPVPLVDDRFFAPPQPGQTPRGVLLQPAPPRGGFAPPPRFVQGPPLVVQPERPERPALADLLRELPPEALPYKPLFQAQAATIAVKLGDATAGVAVHLSYAHPEQAEDGGTAFKTTLYVLRESLPRFWLDLVGFKKETAIEVVRALDRLVEALRKTNVTVTGKTIEATATVPLEPTTVRVLLRGLDLDLPLTAQRANNLKQIGIALHSYHDTRGVFPGTAYYTAEGKPGLSWRVAILPYIEEQALYQQFKLDEPWDSDHNRKLLEKMPKVFAPPPSRKVDVGHTFVQAFSGPGTIFDPKNDRKQARVSGGSTMVNITDGTSNTALVGESAVAVPWTRPDDIPVTGRAVPPLGCVPGSDRCLVLMADGSVHTITTKPPLAAFSNLVGRQDGNPFSIEELKPR